MLLRADALRSARRYGPARRARDRAADMMDRLGTPRSTAVALLERRLP
jgi:hypothetical protein